MDIHVVQPGDTLQSIAEMYGVSEEKIISDNELINPNNLVQGQTIVIVYPTLTYTVQQGDSLESIALMHGVSVMQILRNNPTLASRQYIYPGEILVISYNTTRNITTNGFVYPFVDDDVLQKTLPNLTYLSVLNYRALDEGIIISYYDDTEIIRIAKEYGTIPLIMITTVSEGGISDYDVAYKLLINEEYQDRQINEILAITKAKGYLGVNFVFYFMNINNQHLYFNFIEKVSRRLEGEGLLVFATINPNISNVNGEILFDKVDYSGISNFVDAVTFLQFIWSLNYGPPGPVSSAANLNSFVDYAINYVPPDKFIIGKPIIAYDWILPYNPRNQAANTLTINSAIRLAVDVGAVINFDEPSQTPYFEYIQTPIGLPVNHIVWFIDARSFAALINIINEYNLNGTGVWNIMIYSPQLWLLINSQFDIIKLLPTI